MIRYRDIHKGQDIYIIASGKSMDFINPSFFDNKITIGLNYVNIKFKTDYIVGKHYEVYIDNEKYGVPIFMSRHNCGGFKECLNDFKKAVIFEHYNNERTKIVFPDPQSGMIIVSYSTITSAMHIAAWLGAKNILLCGHDGGTINGQLHFEGYKTGVFEKYKFWLKDRWKETRTVANWLKNAYGCNVYSINPFLSFNLDGNKFKS